MKKFSGEYFWADTSAEAISLISSGLRSLRHFSGADGIAHVCGLG
jgi:hypothetical protein